MTEIREFEELDEEQLTHEPIEKSAYEIYLQHNSREGQELEDWLIAEEELRQKTPKRDSPKRKTVGAD